MANELTITASLQFYKPTIMSSALSRAVTNLLFNVSGASVIGPTTMSVPTSSTAIPLGPVTAPHWAFFMNLDPTNFIRIRNGTAGADLLKLLPGEPAFCPLYDSAVPFAIAAVAACVMEYMIVSL